MQVFNRGIAGETTSNMLARFRREVVHLRPRVVVILGGHARIVYSTQADEHGPYQTGVTYDGRHPTVDGYRRMELLLRQAVQNAISSTNSN